MPQISSKDRSSERQLNPSKIVSDSISNFAGILVPFLIALLTVPLAIKGLGEARYGLLSIVWVILTYLSLLDFGISKASSKFLAEFHGKEDHAQSTRIIHAANLFAILSGLLVGIIMVVTTPWIVGSLSLSEASEIQEATRSFFIISAALPLLFLGTGLRGAMEASRRFHSVNLGLVLTNSISFAIPALSYFIPISLSSIILGVVLIRILNVVYYAILVKRSYKIHNLFGSSVGEEINKLLRYGGWITVSNLISPLLVYMDRILIGALLPIANVAYYAVPYDLVNRIRIFPQALLKTLFPEFSQMDTENRKDETRILIETSWRGIILIVGLVGILISFYSMDILTLWLGEDMALKSAMVMMIFGIGFSINAVAFIPFNYLQSIGRPDIPAKMHLLEFPVYVILLFTLTKYYGILGTALAWAIRVIVDALLNTLFMLYHLKPEPGQTPTRLPGKELLILMIFVLFQAGIQLAALEMIAKVSLVVVSLFLTLVIIWKISLSLKERNWLKSMIQTGLKWD